MTHFTKIGCKNSKIECQNIQSPRNTRTRNIYKPQRTLKYFIIQIYNNCILSKNGFICNEEHKRDFKLFIHSL